MKVNIINQGELKPINYGDIFVCQSSDKTEVYMLFMRSESTLLLSLLDGRSSYYGFSTSYEVEKQLAKDVEAGYLIHYPAKEYGLSLSKLAD